MRSLKSTAVALAAAALLGTGAATAVAAGADSGSHPPSGSHSASSSASAHRTHAPRRDGAKALCKRAPRIEKRLRHRLHRLNGGAGTAGSVDRLARRAKLAKKAGHDAVAAYLDHRLDNRRALPHKLERRKKDLSKVRAWCRTRHHGARNGDASSGATAGARS